MFSLTVTVAWLLPSDVSWYVMPVTRGVRTLNQLFPVSIAQLVQL